MSKEIVQLLYNKYNYFLPIDGAVTKLTELCYGIVALNKEKYVIPVW